VSLRPDEFPLGRRTAPSKGALCGLDSASWQLRERGGIVMSIAKARAALLQIAHPTIAVALAEHSSFESDPFTRVRITGQTVSAILFGSEIERREALRRLGSLHANVRGALEGGEMYAASDPQLMWFVLATLIDSDLLVEQRYVQTFDERDRDAYYDEAKMLADAFGISAALIANNRRELREYIASASDHLAVGDDARRLSARIFKPTFIRARRPIIWGYRQLLVDLLPSRVRVEYGYPPEPPAPARYLITASRALLPHAPSRLRRTRLQPTRP
jgi:uncharacterized protein (DUF2236 family)